MKLLSVKCFATIPCWSRFRKLAKCPFALLARMIFMQRRRMKDLLPRVCVVNRTSNLNSLRSLADCVKKKNCFKGGAASAAKLFFRPHSTNHVIDLWRCRHCCRRRLFDSILLAVHRTILTIATPLPRFSLVTDRSTCHMFLFLPDYCCGRENTIRHKSLQSGVPRWKTPFIGAQFVWNCRSAGASYLC